MVSWIRLTAIALMALWAFACTQKPPPFKRPTWENYGPSADPIWKSPELCDLGANATSFSSFDDMPAVIRAAFLAPYKNSKTRNEVHPFPIVGRDHPFDATDLVGEWPSGSRFIQGGHLGNRWFIWYEQGGFVYRQPILAYELDAPHAQAKFLGDVPSNAWAPIGKRTERSCEVLRDYLNQRGPQPSRDQ